MQPDSKELARRIDAMLAFQNGEPMEYRNSGMKTWVDLSKHGGLSFNWERCDFRKKPVMIEGWIDPKHIHLRRGGGCDIVGCIQVRQVAGE